MYVATPLCTCHNALMFGTMAKDTRASTSISWVCSKRYNQYCIGILFEAGYMYAVIHSCRWCTWMMTGDHSKASHDHETNTYLVYAAGLLSR